MRNCEKGKIMKYKTRFYWAEDIFENLSQALNCIK